MFLPHDISRPASIYAIGKHMILKLISFFYLTTGDCLITVATGPLSDSDADRAGLVSTHAYALLDMRKIQVSRDS